MTAPVPTTDPQFPAQWLALAESICARFQAEFPDVERRYAERGRAFCAHDNAYLVAWLVDALDLAGPASFASNVAWLRALLDARGFPMDAFRRNVDLVAEAVLAMRPEDAERIRSIVAGANPPADP